jgi:hypothetical protein
MAGRTTPSKPSTTGRSSGGAKGGLLGIIGLIGDLLLIYQAAQAVHSGDPGALIGYPGGTLGSDGNCFYTPFA